ncbi:hypothetical protein Poli38472_007907 [Pythium oligandrum]|uniref:Translation initiation factor IF-2, mitochondrial n=1 Tax=Pythium oligandrum TaxID=41045 RepID=A0A8K1FLH0_PYTOL|nr:hypothetical protein Poli38472_007907 [Pythium oligandrum]|eukprot:TMW68235.1 hypothetical protein Poli38472_007907 [Pythium oligandrum]
MTQWFLLRHGLVQTSAARGSVLTLSSAPSVWSVASGRCCVASSHWMRRYSTSSVPDRRKRNHFKSNRDHKGNSSKSKPGNWNLFDSTSGSRVGGSAATNTTNATGGAQNATRGKPAPKKNRNVARRGNAAVEQKQEPVFTNKFQNLLSFAFDEEDDEDGGDKPVDSKESGKSLLRSTSLAPAKKLSGVLKLQQRKEDEEEEEESDEDDIFTSEGTNDLAISALGLDMDSTNDDSAPASLLQKQKKAKPKTDATDTTGKKKLLKKQKKKDGRSLLKNFKFENSIFGGDDDFFGHVDWDERDTENREERRFKRQQRKKDKEKPKLMLPPQEVEIPTRVTVKDLAERMCIKSKVLIKSLRDLGESGLTDDSIITNDIAEVAVESLNMIPILLPPEFVDAELTLPPDDCSSFPVRPPVISVMGHVDHGKTTLLDALRKANVAASEAGGITQSIGAFTVDLGKKFGKLGTMTFIDTPGHAAFSSMRSMGSEVTDIIVLVVAADDGVRPQTEEVIRLAQKNNVPLVVAVTKVDMHAHDQREVIDRIAGELLNLGVVVETMGGETPLVCVSGKTREGLDTLKETIALHAEVMDLRADTTVHGEGVVLEAKIARGVGAQVDTIVKWGTLKTGAIVICGQEYGKIRALVGPDGKRLKQATPGTPVRVIGLKGLPNAGEPLLTVGSEERAKEVVEGREELLQWDLLAATEEAEAEVTGEIAHFRKRRYMGAMAKSREIELRRRQAEEEAKRVASLKVGEDGYVAKVVPIIVKTDSVGVITAIDDLIATLPTEEAVIKRILGAVGPVSSSDLALAEATGATIYEFNVRHPASIDQEALQKNLSLRHHNVIYSLLDDVTELLRENLDGVEETEVIGSAEVIQEIPITKSGRRTVSIAGCRVTSGSMTMQAKYRLLRDGEVIIEDVTMESMRHFQEKVSEVTKGQECGLQFQGIDSFRPGDVLEAYTVKVVKKGL